LNQDELEKVRNSLKELKRRARLDGQLQDDTLESLYEKIRKLEDALDNLSETPHPSDLEELERDRRQLAVIEKIKGMQYPSYLYEFASTLTNPPFSLPTSLMEPEGQDVVTIDIQNASGQFRFRQERMELALAISFPGSFTYRYFGNPIKIQTGPWHSDYTAHLRGIHVLSSDPIFNIERRGRTIAVYKPITLRAQRVFGRTFTCQRCLSVHGLDESCSHSLRIKRPMRIPSSAAIETRVELERSATKDRILRTPLSAMVPRIGYVKNLRVGVAVLGFERHSAGRTASVEYDPPLGTVLETRAVVFPIEVPESFLTHVISSRQYLARDIFVQMLAQRLGSLLSTTGIPAYHMEPSLSGVIAALGLDSAEFSFEAKVKQVLSRDWIESAVRNTLDEGTRYYERFKIDPDRLRQSFENLASSALSAETFRQEVRSRLLHSMAHVILIASCVTSGSGFMDLKYLIGKNEILIFDSVNGGNGSSEMVFEYSSAEDFKVVEESQELERQSVYKPKHLDEALTELLLPCQQGVTERLFVRGLSAPTYREIKRRTMALRLQEDTYREQYSKLSSLGIQSAFPGSVGRHIALSMNLDHQSAERLREVFGICIHGCPDCISLGNKCDAGGFEERYQISKALIDEYVRFMTQDITLPYNATGAEIDQKLRTHGAAILFGTTDSKPEDPHENTRQRAMELDGKKVDKGYIKFAGLWIDNPPETQEIQYRILLVVT
jgi:hypothetical protein